MCRLAAYIGPEINLDDFLLAPEHSLYRQSWEPREMREARLNADGYGFAWIGPEQKPLCYRYGQPIWSDTNLEALAKTLNSRVWLANVRSATPGQMVNLANTQPFNTDELVFMHNGYLPDFQTGFKQKLITQLPADLLSSIHGDTDSEYLFALFRKYYAQTSNVAQSIQALCSEITQLLQGQTALLNMIIYDGNKLYALKHAINGHCPSLYYLTSGASYPGAIVIASERLNESETWLAVPEHHLISFDDQLALHAIPIV